MAEEKNILDNVFRNKLQKEVDFVMNDSWEEMDVLLQKKKFFVFTFKNFNIYYASLIATGFVLGLAGFVNMLIVNSNTTTLYNHTIVHDTTLIKNEKATISPKTSINTNSNLSKDKKNKSSHENSHTVLLSQDESLLLKRDSIQTENRTISPQKDIIKEIIENNNKPVIVKRKKTVYVTEYDTIMKYDTLKTKKRRK